MFETIAIEVTAPIGRLALNRPEKLNPLSPLTLEELIAAAGEFDRNREVKVVVVSGAGRAFTAGADLGALAGPARPGTLRRDSGDLGWRMAEAIAGMRAVTVVAIHGWCVGGGVVLAGSCDLRVAGESARFSIPEVDLGIPLGWGGIPRLVREIGPARTKELVMTCRPFSAAEAYAIGFVNTVVADEDVAVEVDRLAQVLASKSALTLTVTKRHVDAVAREMGDTGHGFADGDLIAMGFSDPEGAEVRTRYMASLVKRRAGGVLGA